MRRLLAITLAAGLPALAAAQTAPPAGQLRTVDFDAVNGSLIGTAQCNGTRDLEVTWAMQPSTTGGTVATGLGTVRIFASNKQRTVTEGDPRTCWLDTDNFGGDTTIKTATVTKFDGITMQQNRQTIPGSDVAAMATALGLNCSATTSVAIYLCALPYQNSTSTTRLNGVANGTFSLDTARPDQVSGVTVKSADGALVVSFTEPDTEPNATDFRAEARAGDTVVRSATGNSPIRIGGLTNGVEYAVTVTAISASGNESAPFPGDLDPKVFGTPSPSVDFWELYKDSPGATEQGGCATGAAGALGVLGAAALLRLRRRKP